MLDPTLHYPSIHYEEEASEQGEGETEKGLLLISYSRMFEWHGREGKDKGVCYG